MGKVEKCSSALDFSIEFPPSEIVDHRMQNYDYFVNLGRLVHGSGVNPKNKLEFDSHVSNADIIEVFGAIGRYKTTDESCIQVP